MKLGKIGSLPEVIFLVSLVSQIWSYVLLPFIFLLLIFVNVPVGIALENPLLRRQSKSVKQKITSIKLVKHNLAQIINTYSMFCNFLFIHWCQFLHKLLRISSMKWDVDKRKSVDNFTAFSKEPLFTYLYIIKTMVFFYIHEKWCLLIIQCKESKVYAGSMIRKLKHFIWSSSNIMIKWQLAPVIYTKADEYSFVSPSWPGSKLKSPSKIISFSPRNN